MQWQLVILVVFKEYMVGFTFILRDSVTLIETQFVTNAILNFNYTTKLGKPRFEKFHDRQIHESPPKVWINL